MGLFSFLFGTSTNSNEDLKLAINEGAFLVDVRSKDEYNSGSAKGAVNIPLNAIPHNLKKFKEKKQIVVFCRSGARSSQAKSILGQNGFSNVINGGTWNKVRSLQTL